VQIPGSRELVDFGGGGAVITITTLSAAYAQLHYLQGGADIRMSSVFAAPGDRRDAHDCPSAVLLVSDYPDNEDYSKSKQIMPFLGEQKA
jgi:hypothetical protein